MIINLLDSFLNTDQLHITPIFDKKEIFDGFEARDIVSPLVGTMDILRIDNEKYEVVSKITMDVMSSCDRCTKDTVVSVVVNTEKVIDITDEEDSVFVDKKNFDIDKFIELEIISNFPSKILCSDECKGLCKECGQDLNTGECDCEKGHVDVRWAGLKDLFDSEF